MRLNWRIFLGCCALAMLPALATQAARNASPAHLPATSDQLIVFEDDGCIYCRLFRRDVLPRYQTSRRAKSLPIHFVSVRQSEGLRRRLNAPLSVVPTFVVMRNGREIGRIDGYTGPGPFFRLIRRIVGHVH